MPKRKAAVAALVAVDSPAKPAKKPRRRPAADPIRAPDWLESRPIEARVEGRRDLVVAWLARGRSSLEVADAIRWAWPDADPATLLLDATNELEAAGEVDPAIVRGFCTNAALSVYKQAREVGDPIAALNALRLVAKLHGLT